MERGPKVKWLKNEEKKTSLWVEEKEVLSAKGTRLAAAVLKVNVPCSVFYFEIYIPGRRMEIVETTNTDLEKYSPTLKRKGIVNEKGTHSFLRLVARKKESLRLKESFATKSLISAPLALF